MLLSASLTGSFVTLATHIIHSLGLWGVGGLVLISAVIGIPGTEAPMLFAGFNVYQGNFSLIGIIAFGVGGDLIGASIAYAIAFFGLHEVLARPGSPLHISEHKLQTAHAWFERYGSPVIVVSRLIPLLRAAFPYAAGLAEMAYWRFIAMAAIGSTIWITGLALLGRAVGSDWQSWRHNLEYVDYAAVVLVVCAIAYLAYRQRQRQRAAL